MAGRPPRTEKISQAVIDAVVALWVDPDDELGFTQIHEALMKKGIVQKINYRYKTDRILKRLSSKDINLIEKVGRGRYRLKVNPDEFKLFDYLQRIRQQAKFEVGGTFSKQAELYMLGMPKNAWNHIGVKYALEIINIRISELFIVLSTLSRYVKTMNKEGAENKVPRLPSLVIRELMLELLPYYLGSKAGCDFDGLSIEELIIVISKMIEGLPEEVEAQSPIMKDIIKENFKLLNKLNSIDSRVDDNELYEQFHSKPDDFALIVTLPEFSIDETGHEKRQIKSSLEEYEKDSKSALFIASSLLIFENESVLSILDIYGRTFLGKQKWKETYELYKSMYASYCAAHAIDHFGSYGKKLKREAMEYIQKLVNEQGIRNIIYYLPFSQVRLNFILPTEDKEKILGKVFPQLGLDTIHKWLGEGAAIANIIAKQKIDDLKKILESQHGKES